MTDITDEDLQLAQIRAEIAKLETAKTRLIEKLDKFAATGAATIAPESYARQKELLKKINRGLADARTAEKRLELRIRVNGGDPVPCPGFENPATPWSAESSAQDGVASKLERLAALHVSGTLDDAEFRAAKARIIDG